MDKAILQAMLACLLWVFQIPVSPALDSNAEKAVRAATFEFIAPGRGFGSKDLVGTAFAIGPNQFVTAAHLIDRAVGSHFEHPVLMDSSRTRYAVADIVTGGLVLAVVTSLPNAVSAVYLARRGRGAAVLSTALNSNAINVVGGLLIPASLAGLGPGSGQDTLVAALYAGLTVLALALAYHGRGVGRATGTAIIAGYLAFVTALIVTVEQGGVRPAAAVLPAVAVACTLALTATHGQQPLSGNHP